ncbi:NACHT C-terminal alpha/beta 1 domain-containing protein [Coleofasciculus sp. B1-GNL1-01]|uniref:NACHT C-terminal alpha/beta 1 domain-containing protein n=1 Tax=Coleofasciculus sp. B1-GNL1-01 TaxID=3068484 RepID=UPI004063A7DD
MRCLYRDTFITELIKFEGRICIITDKRLDPISLDYFVSSQLIADVVDWIRAIAAINSSLLTELRHDHTHQTYG